MLLNVLDSNAVSQKVVSSSQEAVTDVSGTIASTGVSQIAIQPNAFRSGYLIQNTSNSPMYLNELGNDANANGGSFLLASGAFFPPTGYFGLTVEAVSILGTVGQTFTAREW